MKVNLLVEFNREPEKPLALSLCEYTIGRLIR